MVSSSGFANDDVSRSERCSPRPATATLTSARAVDHGVVARERAVALGDGSRCSRVPIDASRRPLPPRAVSPPPLERHSRPIGAHLRRRRLDRVRRCARPGCFASRRDRRPRSRVARRDGHPPHRHPLLRGVQGGGCAHARRRGRPCPSRPRRVPGVPLRTGHDQGPHLRHHPQHARETTRRQSAARRGGSRPRARHRARTPGAPTHQNLRRRAHDGTAVRDATEDHGRDRDRGRTGREGGERGVRQKKARATVDPARRGWNRTGRGVDGARLRFRSPTRNRARERSSRAPRCRCACRTRRFHLRFRRLDRTDRTSRTWRLRPRRVEAASRRR